MGDRTQLRETELPPPNRSSADNANRSAALKRLKCSVWRKTMKDYHDLYLACDVLQSADILEISVWASIA